MCNWQSRDDVGFISRGLFESCIDQLAEMKVEVLNLQFGGESLLHPDFREFLRYAINKRDEVKFGEVGFTTNGMLFDESIADLVVCLGVDWVNFSLDGVGKVNDEIRLGSNYSVVEKNIKYLLNKRGSRKTPKVLLNIVDHGKTEEQKTDFYREWANVVDEIELIPSILPDNSWENKQTLCKTLKTISPPTSCHIPLDTMVISWDGKVTYCCFDTCFKSRLGNASEESIKQIWNGPRFRSLRAAVLTNTFSDNLPCYGCDFWQINFEPREELILDGRAMMQYGYIYRRVRSVA